MKCFSPFSATGRQSSGLYLTPILSFVGGGLSPKARASSSDSTASTNKWFKHFILTRVLIPPEEEGKAHEGGEVMGSRQSHSWKEVLLCDESERRRRRRTYSSVRLFWTSPL